MSKSGITKGRFITNIWVIAMWAVAGSLLCLSYYMLVRSQVLNSLADVVGINQGTLYVTANVFGVAGIVIGLPSLITFCIGNFLKKY